MNGSRDVIFPDSYRIAKGGEPWPQVSRMHLSRPTHFWSQPEEVWINVTTED